MSVLLLEAFYGGSHKQLVDLLMESVEDCVSFTLPAKKWHWRARTSALYLMQAVPARSSYRVLFTSSLLNLTELVALRPDLAHLKKVLYFHENQLVYPVRKSQERDFQYGYNQILSCLVADVVVFNSAFNMESFLSSIFTFMKTMPDHRPKDLDRLIRPKCHVLHFPICFPDVTRSVLIYVTHSLLGITPPLIKKCASEFTLNPPPKADRVCKREALFRSPVPIIQDLCQATLQGTHTDETNACDGAFKMTHLAACPELTLDLEPPEKILNVTGPQQSLESMSVTPRKETLHQSVSDPCGDERGNLQPLHIVWPHRWEHDKDPQLFFQTLLKLKEQQLSFEVSVLGETFADIPDIFSEAKEQLVDHIQHWGFMPSKEDYLKALCQADVVVSTAKHEFFGVAMLEAVHCGCYPLYPKALVYPEIFPATYLYSTPEQLCKRLQDFCKRPQLVRHHVTQVNLHAFSWDALGDSFRSLLGADSDRMLTEEHIS
ncbi:glycosyltransferase-like domain-containing protein 1 [Carassius carassius]|uniref:glycosyltransferase-like domain-containing protein 1 n=1 Tax=Carassius carassius TaxID=217509 RepID=UPI002868E899|nr:glycosyltransferase-like domain-containing protein 1 [Carassius carassius]